MVKGRYTATLYYTGLERLGVMEVDTLPLCTRMECPNTSLDLFGTGVRKTVRSSFCSFTVFSTD